MKHRLAILAAAIVCLGTVPFVAGAGAAVAAQPVPVQAGRHAQSTPSGTRSAAIDVRRVTAEGVAPEILELALAAVRCATTSGAIDEPPTLTLIDYSKPSTEPRLWVFDMATGKLLFKELVAHGRNTGENLAKNFSDDMNSRQSSLGLFRTADTYTGSNGYSLRLDGLEPGFNAHARDRAIVMHGAAYVDPSLAAAQGRIGRSWGCPALRTAIAARIIDTIRGGGVIFSYYPDQKWLQTSRFLNCSGSPEHTLATR